MADEPGSSVPATEPDPTPAGDPPVEPARTFTQADVDRIVKDRLQRQAAQFSGYDDLKAKAAKFDEIEAAQRTDLENAQAKIAELEREHTAAVLAARDERLRSAIVTEAAKRSVRDPDAAVALIDRAAIEFDDDGYPTNIAQAMDSLLEARDYLVSTAQAGARGSADQGARGNGAPQIAREDLKRMSSAEIVAAQKEGRLDHLFGGS